MLTFKKVMWENPTFTSTQATMGSYSSITERKKARSPCRERRDEKGEGKVGGQKEGMKEGATLCHNKTVWSLQ